MSNESKDEQTVPSSKDEAVVEEVELAAAGAKNNAELAETIAKTPQASKSAKKSRGGAIAWLALLFSIATMATLAYLIFEGWRDRQAADQTGSSISSLGSQIEASQESVSGLDRRITELAGADANTASALESLQRDLDDRIRQLESLPPRMSGIESSVASLQGVSVGTRDTWLLAEAEYYLQIANVQLQLAGNPQLAALALGMADERVVQLANPALFDVRAAISDELAALEVMERPDIEGMTLTLSSLARVIDSLPLKGRDSSNAGVTADIDTDLSAVDRALAAVRDTMSGLVKITPPDQAAMPLVTPDAVYFLRTNLTLHLQIARLALLRGEKAVFEQSLDDATEWLEQYFDTESAQVAGSLQTIAEIRGKLFSVTPPDISESLRLLRQFRMLAVSAQ